jgi:hypothetical protein
MSFERVAYDRRFTVLLDGKEFIVAGDGRQLKIEFTIEGVSGGSLSTADIAIYNLSDTSIIEFFKTGIEISLHAGYANNEGGIFTGQINSVLKERAGADTITRILAVSNFRTKRVINQPFPVNTKVVEIIKACADAMGYPLVWTPEHFDDEPLYTRGYDLPGVSAQESLEYLARIHGFSLIVDKAKIVIFKNGHARNVSTIVISEKTGMEGIPEISHKGCDVATRLNPQLAIGGLFEIDARLRTFNTANFHVDNIPEGAGRGIYQILRLVHDGDSWGDVWTSKITGLRPV